MSCKKGHLKTRKINKLNRIIGQPFPRNDCIPHLLQNQLAFKIVNQEKLQKNDVFVSLGIFDSPTLEA